MEAIRIIDKLMHENNELKKEKSELKDEIKLLNDKIRKLRLELEYKSLKQYDRHHC